VWQVLHAVPDTAVCDIVHSENPVPPPGADTEEGAVWQVPQLVVPIGKWFAGSVTMVAAGKVRPVP
jgi:hypothetical protein